MLLCRGVVFTLVTAFGIFLVCRWDRVAELVPGKSKAQCFKRFKEMRDAHRSRKGKGANEMDD